MQRFTFVAILDDDTDVQYCITAKNKAAAVEAFLAHMAMNNYALPLN